MARPLALLLIAAAALTVLFLAPGALAADGNDFWPSATPINIGPYGPFEINPAGDVDWYSFNISDAGTLDIFTNGTNGSTLLYLYDASLNNVAYDDGSLFPWSHIRGFVVPGEYFAVASAQVWNATFNYTLTLGIDLAPVLVEGLNGPFTMNNTTKIDWFVLNVTERSTLVLQTNGSSGDSELYLFDRWFNVITYDYDGATPWARLSAFLNTGLYFLRVEAIAYNTTLTGYTIDLQLTPPTPLADGTNGPFHVASTEPSDWFFFDVASTQSIKVVIPAVANASFQMNLYDLNLNGIASDSYGNGTSAARIILSLDPGRYYLSVSLYYCCASSADYDLVLARAGPAGFDGNDLMAYATLLPFGRSGPFDLDPAGDGDWYMVSLPTQGVFETDIVNGGWTTSIAIYDENGSWVAETDPYYYGSGQTLAMVRPAGILYVLVHDTYSNQVVLGYSVDVDFTAPPPPDLNDEAKNATTTHTGANGPFTLYTGDTDWYTFVADVPGTIFAETSGPRGGTTLDLYNNGMSHLAYGSTSGNYSFQYLSLAVDLGTYYLRVGLPSSLLAVREYNLTITFTPWVSQDGNDFGSQARKIVAGPNGPYSLHPVADNDWYYFDVGDAGETIIQVLATVDLTVLLYNSSWSVVTQSQYTGQPIDAALEAGRYFARVSSTYYYGEVDAYRLNLTLPDFTPPQLAITLPANGTHVTTGSIRVSGTTEPGAHVWVDGGEVVVNTTGAFTKVVAVPVGENDIIVVARDIAGNEAQAMVTVISVDPNDQIVVQIAQLNSALNTTQQQLAATQQALAAAQAATANQTAASNTSTEHLQSQLDAANASIGAARAEASAQRSYALMGLILGAVALAAAVVGLRGRRNVPGPAASTVTVLPQQELNAKPAPSPTPADAPPATEKLPEKE